MSKKKKTEAVERKDPLKPELGLLVALGSLAVHIEELLSTPSVVRGKSVGDQIEGLASSADFDLAAIRGCLNQQGVKEWLTEMQRMALLPVKR